MRGRRHLAVSAVVATGLLLAATVGLASLLPRPLRSALTVLHALTFRVATDWLAVVALLAVGGRYVAGATVDRATVGGLAAGVFLGGLAIEASPLVRLVVAPSPVGADRLLEAVIVAVQRAAFPTGLFLATVVGAATARARLADERGSDDGTEGPDGDGGRPVPLGPSSEWVPDVTLSTVARTVAVVAAAGAVSFGIEAGLRVGVGASYTALAVADAAVNALGTGVGYAVLAVGFVGLVVEGVGRRSLVRSTALVWGTTVLGGIAVGVLSAGLGVALVSVTATPMPAVEAARFGRWPTPYSWATLLRVGTFLAGAVGLLAVQRTAPDRGPPGRPATDADAGTGTDLRAGPASGSGSDGGSARPRRDAAGRASNAEERR
jgi:hypothetical protein